MEGRNVKTSCFGPDNVFMVRQEDRGTFGVSVGGQTETM